ncbi:MAG: sensor domain-containing diguanylate cyclase [Desulfotomaculaceae bacterium]|nr:sensor domain-containing diguanylate cyclase [Desulfotomaculaceae bacterium]
MRAKQGAFHIIFTWLVVGLAVWQLALLLPTLELDSVRELLLLIFLGVLAECLAVPFAYGRLSGAFVLILSTFLIYGLAAAAWLSGLSTLFGQGIANRGNPVRTVFFNAGQYVLAVSAAAGLFRLSGGAQGQPLSANIFPLLVFTISYIAVNHILVNLYLAQDRHGISGHVSWFDSIKWDLLTYFFTVPLGILIAMMYGYTGLSGTFLLFFSILAVQLILRFYVRLQVTNMELTAFYRVAKALEGKPNSTEIIEQILTNAKRAVPFRTGVAYLRPEEGAPCLPVAVTGLYARQLMSTAVYQGEGVIGLALENREPEIIYDTRTHSLAKKEPGLCRIMRSLIIIPLFSGSDSLGVIVLGEKKPMVFDDKHLHIMTVLAGQAAVALENYLLKHRLSQVLSRDTLTGLLNFDTLWDTVSEHCASSQAAGYPIGLILLDIDRFKVFNKHYGREAGEMLLVELANLLSSSLRKDDAASRYGGDEFALLLPWAGGARLVDLAEALLKKIRDQYFLRGQGRSARITVSIGFAEIPRDAGDPAGIFNVAQRALDRAKESGGDRAMSAAPPLVD